MKVADPLKHYLLDAEYFDYFEPPNRIDGDTARRIQDSVFAALAESSGGIVLDIGSGNGWLQRKSSERRTFEVVSMDLGLRNLRVIRSEYPSAVCVVADASRLPFRSNSVSAVVASEVLEHVNAPQFVLAEAYRLLKTGGRLIISTPYKERIRQYLCIHCNQLTPQNAHLHSFDEERHRTSLLETGFSGLKHFTLLGRLFTRSRLSYALRFLPFSLWRIMDRLSIRLFRDGQTIVITATKPPLSGT
jgi:ubiquinone/menaquinone biosynthesis C-methylase UbiE